MVHARYRCSSAWQTEHVYVANAPPHIKNIYDIGTMASITHQGHIPGIYLTIDLVCGHQAPDDHNMLFSVYIF